MTEPRVSYIVIGLNEAAHLHAAFAAIAAQGLPPDECELIYVDSGSTDRSLEIAEEAGASQVLSIGREGASAAKARNAGLAVARGQFVQFVDGDSQLEPGWMQTALAALSANAGLSGVEGHLREARPEANLLHSLCELDWPTAAGPADFVGGNSLYRRAPIAAAGGFDDRMRLGEEAELGFRMRGANGTFEHLDCIMARHDLDMRGLGDYWRRGQASGRACAWVAHATGGYWSDRVRATLVHASWQTLPLLVAAGIALVSPPAALVTALMPVALLGVLGLRKGRRMRRLIPELSAGLAFAYGIHAYVFKIPSAAGALAGMWNPPKTAPIEGRASAS